MGWGDFCEFKVTIVPLSLLVCVYVEGEHEHIKTITYTRKSRSERTTCRSPFSPAICGSWGLHSNHQAGWMPSAFIHQGSTPVQHKRSESPPLSKVHHQVQTRFLSESLICLCLQPAQLSGEVTVSVRLCHFSFPGTSKHSVIPKTMCFCRRSFRK